MLLHLTRIIIVLNLNSEGIKMKIFKNVFIVLLFICTFSCQKSEDKKKEPEPVIESETTTTPLFNISEGYYQPEMVLVDGGEFIMGNPDIKTNQPHRVDLSSFFMSSYMVTVDEWKLFLNDVKLKFTWDWNIDGYGPFYETIPTDDCPAQGLNWYYAIIFCNWASLKDGFNPAYIITELPDEEFTEISVKWDKTANGYRLPTDAEWEYAARGGRQSKGFKYPGSDDPNEIARFGKEFKSSYPVGEYIPNELDIYDMGGNASEWCWDWYDEIMFEWLPIENPSIDHAEDVKQKSRYGHDFKVIRGGSWYGGPIETSIRGTYRPMNIFSTGIRLVRNAE